MATAKTEIIVYAHWKGMPEPKLIGVLTAQQAKGRKAISFKYDDEWLHSKEQRLLDPEINWYSGPQFPSGKENFGMIMDSMPDTWGRILMKRRETIQARETGRPVRTLHEIDFLLGVNDETRMGALRFKLDSEGDFLNNEQQMSTPSWTSVRELQYAAGIIESNSDVEEVKKWLAVLLAPGSSLGGGRPKANVIDSAGSLWVAKFPSSNDQIDKGAWEYLAYLLAIKCGIKMPDCRIEKVSGKYHTFFTKRFDREQRERIHFASAMTMTCHDENDLKDSPASYLEIAEFIQYNGIQNKHDLQQLWRRIVYHIAISNTDDHLRNHGFLLMEKGWILSPAYDINPSIDKEGLALNIDADQNHLDFELAKSVGEYFQLTTHEMDIITDEIKKNVSNWRVHANHIGISRAEQEMMAAAFRY